jgi:Flp pilus assembly protein TadD
MSAAWMLADLAAGLNLGRVLRTSLAVLLLVLLGWRTFDQAGHWKDSLALWEHTLSVTENNYVAHLFYGRELAAAGRHGEARLQLARAIQMRGDFPDAHFRLGVILLREGNLPAAREHFLKALAHSTRPSADPHHNLGSIYLTEGNLDQALYHLKKAVEIVDDLPDTYLNLGVVWWQKGDRERAIGQFRRAEKLAPANPQVLEALARALAETGDFAEAQALVERALAVPLEPPVRDRLQTAQRAYAEGTLPPTQ